MKLLVGLGNPGESYARNRHNVGFMALAAIARAHALPAWRRRFQGHTTEGSIDGERCLLLLPGTYMNESGRAVGEAMRFLKLEPADVIVFHDELDLVPGKLKVKLGGGNAGHNGLRSISAHCGNEFVRVRIGIGHPGSKDVVQHYVLHDFAKADEAWLKPLLEAMASAAGWLAKGEAERFLTEVARLTRPATERKPEPRNKADAARKPEPPAASSEAVELSETARPGEPAGPGGALADKLKRWLTSKDRRH